MRLRYRELLGVSLERRDGREGVRHASDMADQHPPHRPTVPPVTVESDVDITPARLGAFDGLLRHARGARRWRGHLPIGAVAPLLATAVGGGRTTLETVSGQEYVRLTAVWFDADSGYVDCDLEPGERSTRASLPA